MNNITKLNENDETSDIIKLFANSEDASKEVMKAVTEFNDLSETEKNEFGETAVGVAVRLKHATAELVGALGYTQQQLEISNHTKLQLQQENELNKKIIKQIECNKKYDKDKVESLKKEYISTQISAGKVIPGNLILACDALKNYRSASGRVVEPDKLYMKSIKK